MIGQPGIVCVFENGGFADGGAKGGDDVLVGVIAWDGDFDIGITTAFDEDFTLFLAVVLDLHQAGLDRVFCPV